jgi:hypothetical protein
MIFFYPLVSKICLKHNGNADRFPYGVFVDRKIMLAAFCFFYINDLKTLLLYYDLRF